MIFRESFLVQINYCIKKLSFKRTISYKVDCTDQCALTEASHPSIGHLQPLHPTPAYDRSWWPRTMHTPLLWMMLCFSVSKNKINLM